MVVETFVGLRCGPRPRFTTGVPSISSAQGGLSESLTLALKFFGFCNVVARFILFSPAQRDHVWSLAAFSVDKHYHLAVESTEGNQPLLVVTLAYILACDREIVPNGFAADEVQTMNPEVGLALLLIPRNHRVNCSNNLPKVQAK